MYKRIVLTLMLGVFSVGVWAGSRVDETRSMSPDGRLNLSAVTGEFQLVGSDQGRLVITGTLGSDVREFIIEGDDDSWTVKLQPIEQQGRMPRRTDSSRLTIMLPRGAEIDMSTVSGRIEARNLRGRQVSLQTVSGSVQLDAVAPDRLEVQTVSGEQRMDAGGYSSTRLRSVSGNIGASNLTARISVNSVSGSIRLDGVAVNELDVETVSGRLGAELEPTTGARYRLSSHSGNLGLTLPAGTPLALRANTFSGRISSDFGGEVRRGRGPGEQLDHRVGHGNVQVETKSFSGNIEIRQHQSDRGRR